MSDVCLHVSIQLARRGLDIVLVSRSDEKLRLVAKEIGERSHSNITPDGCVISSKQRCVCVSVRGASWTQDSHHPGGLHRWPQHLLCYS